MKKRGPSHLDFIFNAEQKAALATIQKSVAEQKFSVSLLHGVTGSGKTAVYLAAMQAVLEQGRAAILLVPESGLRRLRQQICIRFLGMKSPFCIRRFQPTSARSSGTAYAKAMRGSWSARVQQFLRRWRIWR